MQTDHDHDDLSAEINVTPMVDLFMVLLLIFMILCTASVAGLKVNLPSASSAPSLNQPKTQSITVNNEGKVFLNTSPVTLDQLEQKLTQQRALTPDFPIVIRGDTVTQYHSVTEVLDLLVRLGLTKVALATKPLAK